jgi:hypothetical protein
MSSINDVYFSVRHITAIGFRLRGIERELILASDHQQVQLPFAHPGLPFRIGVDVRAVVVK